MSHRNSVSPTASGRQSFERCSSHACRSFTSAATTVTGRPPSKVPQTPLAAHYTSTLHLRKQRVIPSPARGANLRCHLNSAHYCPLRDGFPEVLPIVVERNGPRGRHDLNALGGSVHARTLPRWRASCLPADSPTTNAGDPDCIDLDFGMTDLDGHARVLCGRGEYHSYRRATAHMWPESLLAARNSWNESPRSSHSSISTR